MKKSYKRFFVFGLFLCFFVPEIVFGFGNIDAGALYKYTNNIILDVSWKRDYNYNNDNLHDNKQRHSIFLACNKKSNKYCGENGGFPNLLSFDAINIPIRNNPRYIVVMDMCYKSNEYNNDKPVIYEDFSIYDIKKGDYFLRNEYFSLVEQEWKRLAKTKSDLKMVSPNRDGYPNDHTYFERATIEDIEDNGFILNFIFAIIFVFHVSAQAIQFFFKNIFPNLLIVFVLTFIIYFFIKKFFPNFFKKYIQKHKKPKKNKSKPKKSCKSDSDKLK